MRLWVLCKNLFRSIQEIGVVDKDLLHAPRIRFLNTACLISILGLNLNLLMYCTSGPVDYSVLAFALSFQVAVLLVFLANKWRAYFFARFLFLVVFTTLFLSGNLVISFIGSENFLFMALLMAFNLLERKISFVLITLYYASLYCLIVYGMNIGYLTNGGLSWGYYYYVNSSLAFFIEAILAYRYSSLINKQIKIMQKLNEDLHKKNILTNKLLKELNHRVKNNLQIIASLFNLQGNSTENIETRQALADARSRINSIAILHQNLYQGDLVFEVDAKDYLQSLCEYLRHSDSQTQSLQIELRTVSIILQIKETIYLGLMVNELITNAFKYARKPNQLLQIQVLLTLEEPKHLLLEVRDNGPGFSTDNPSASNDSFGLGLVRIITEQYDGRLQLFNAESGGAVVIAGMELP